MGTSWRFRKVEFYEWQQYNNLEHLTIPYLAMLRPSDGRLLTLTVTGLQRR